jgi:hypothetical protein
MFNGELVDGSDIACYNHSGVDLREFKKSYRSQRYQAKECNTIYCEQNTVVIENDVGHRRGLMGKILPLIVNQDKKPYLIQFNEHTEYGAKKTTTAKQNRAKWIKDTKWDGEFLKLSELPQHKLSEFGYVKNGGGNGSYATKDAKHSAKCFEFDWKHEASRWERKKSGSWKIADLDVENETGVYVILDQFQIERKESGNYDRFEVPNRIKDFKEMFEQMGLTFPKHIYAFKVAQRNKIEGKDGWENLFDWAKAQLEAIIEKDNLHQAWLDIQQIDKLHNGNGNHSSRYRDYEVNTSKEALNRWKEVKLAVADGVFGSFLQKYDEMKQTDVIHKKIKAIQSVAKDFSVEFTSPKGVKPTYDIKKEAEKVYDKYSMLHMVDNSIWNWGWNKHSVKQLTNYINVIDVCEHD